MISAYFEAKAVPERLIKQIFKSGKNWDVRKERIKIIANEILSGRELEEFQSSMDGFYNDIRPLRNSFSHEDLQRISYKSIERAYVACFPIFWGLEFMRKSIALS